MSHRGHPKNWPYLLLSGFLLIVVEIFLRARSFQDVVKLSLRIHRSGIFSSFKARRMRLIERISEAIPIMDRHLVFISPSCLRRSLALKLLHGPQMPIFIGVRRIGTDEIEAHAWTPAADPSEGELARFQELGTL